MGDPMACMPILHSTAPPATPGSEAIADASTSCTDADNDGIPPTYSGMRRHLGPQSPRLLAAHPSPTLTRRTARAYVNGGLRCLRQTGKISDATRSVGCR